MTRLKVIFEEFPARDWCLKSDDESVEQWEARRLACDGKVVLRLTAKNVLDATERVLLSREYQPGKAFTENATELFGVLAKSIE